MRQIENSANQRLRAKTVKTTGEPATLPVAKPVVKTEPAINDPANPCHDKTTAFTQEPCTVLSDGEAVEDELSEALRKQLDDKCSLSEGLVTHMEYVTTNSHEPAIDVIKEQAEVTVPTCATEKSTPCDFELKDNEPDLSSRSSSSVGGALDYLGSSTPSPSKPAVQSIGPSPGELCSNNSCEGECKAFAVIKGETTKVNDLVSYLMNLDALTYAGSHIMAKMGINTLELLKFIAGDEHEAQHMGLLSEWLAVQSQRHHDGDFERNFTSRMRQYAKAPPADLQVYKPADTAERLSRPSTKAKNPDHQSDHLFRLAAARDLAKITLSFKEIDPDYIEFLASVLIHHEARYLRSCERLWKSFTDWLDAEDLDLLSAKDSLVVHKFIQQNSSSVTGPSTTWQNLKFLQKKLNVPIELPEKASTSSDSR